MPMNKANINDLVKQLADKDVLQQTDAELFIRKMFDVANEGLERDKLVKIKWLGTFKVQAVKDRESVDVNTGDRIVIEGRDKIAFTPDNILKEIVNKPFAQFETVVVNDGVDFDSIDQKFEHMAEKELDNAATSRISTVLADASTHLEDKQNEDKHEVSLIQEETSVEAQEETSVDVQEETSAEVQEESPVDVPEKSSDETSTKTPTNVQTEASTNVQAETLANVQADALKDVRTGISEEAPQDVLGNRLSDNSVDELSANKETIPAEESDKHHFVIPRYAVVLVALVVVVLIGGMGYFAFNYGKIQAQRDQLAMQLQQHISKPVAHKAIVKKPAVPSQDELLRQKAMDDSIRMAKEAESVKEAEAAKKAESESVEKQADETRAKDKTVLHKQDQEKSLSKVDDKTVSYKYDQDPRVRTGAYRIVGVQQVVTARNGQTVAAISSRYLGPGMECYVEALNGSGPLKEGQKVKIPKLELKKKK